MLLGIISSTNPNKNLDPYEGMVVELYVASVPFATRIEGVRRNKQFEAPLLRTQIDDLGHLAFKPVLLANTSWLFIYPIAN
jgi:hypothetical protein